MAKPLQHLIVGSFLHLSRYGQRCIATSHDQDAFLTGGDETGALHRHIMKELIPMFKTKIDGQHLAELESELAGKRKAHALAVSNFAETRDRADALADKVARAALTGDLDLQNLEAELDAAERRARAFASARNQVGAEIRELAARLDHEKTRGQRETTARYLEAIADQIVRLVAELRPGMARLQAAMEASGFPDLLSFADLNLARIFPHNVFLGAGAIASGDPELWVETIRRYAAEIRSGTRSFELGETATQIAEARAASDDTVWRAIAAGTRRLLKTA